jgi:Uma2 family endonuclease
MARGIMEAMATTTLMSFAEFERLDGGPDDLELLKGELVRVPPASRSHMEICRRLFRLLDDFVERLRSEGARDVGTVFFEMGYRLGGGPPSWLKPDISVSHSAQSGDAYFEGAPLIAFEVVSRNDKAEDLNAKVAEYLANGAREVWLIYPKTRDALVFAADAVRTERSIRTSLLPGLDIPLDQIF